MIEIQINDENIYESLKQYASYHSDVTKVCAFRDEMSEMLQEYGIEVETNNQDSNSEEKPILTITNRNIMRLDNAQAEMLYFVGVRSEFDPTIPIAKMHEVSLLIENELIIPDDKFKELYSPLGYRNKVSDLLASNIKFYGKGKVTDYLDANSTIMSFKFPDCKEKKLNYKQMTINIASSLTKFEKYDEIIGKDQSGNRIILRFFNRPLILKSIAFKGNSISISTSKVIGQDDSYIIYDPFILPKGLIFDSDIMYTPPGRKIPADLYRNCLYEFMYRYNIAKTLEK